MIQNPVRRNALFAALIVAAAALLWLSGELHAAFIESLELSKALIEQYPLGSRLAFIVIAAVSATLVLFSSVALVPVAVYAWGEEQTLGLLMLGWFAGANMAYFVGRRFGRRLTEYFIAARTLERYGHLLAGELSVAAVAVLRLSLPSEMPSVAMGILRYPASKFQIVALASELPFALWAVYLSAALIDDRRALFLLLLLAGFAALAILTHRLLRRQGATKP